MEKILSLVTILLTLCVCRNTRAAAWYVDAGVEVPGDGTSWETAFQKIQEGINAASPADTVIVAEGAYVENIHFHGKNITLTSTNPLDSDVIAKTVIDGNQSGSVVTFSGIEDETCLLSGFTITNAYLTAGYTPGGGVCGGSYEHYTHATIENNVITNNRGGSRGVTFSNGIIRNNTITQNSNGGLFACNGTVFNNTISGNSCSGLCSCDGLIEDNVVTENSWRGLLWCDGTIRNNVISKNLKGGLSECDGLIVGNIIAGNSRRGLYSCNGAIQNNTIFGNSDGGLDRCQGTIMNCIIWANGAELQLRGDCSVPTYSCIEKWCGGGQGNIAFKPYLMDAENGDFHLKSWSPCIDAGDPTSPFSNEPDSNGGCVNMGAYGNTPEATSKSPDIDSDALPDDWEIYWFRDLAEDATSDTDGDKVLNVTEYLHAWNPTTAATTLVENITKGRWYQTIQAALVESDDMDEIVAHPGVHNENISFGGRNVVLRSTDPSNPQIVADTIIDGGQKGRAIVFLGTEKWMCVVSGFTITNGRGGIDGDGTNATIHNNVITANSDPWRYGAGLYRCDGIIRNNVISANSTEGAGGGLDSCNGQILNNIITGNSAGWGGGLYECDGIIKNNVISHNEPTGLCDCDGLIENNTIAENSGCGDGIALLYCDAAILNCVIWGNRGGSQLSDCSAPAYCCIEKWTPPGRGDGNLALYPHFVDPENEDFHLLSWSPCIDTGDSTSDFSKEPQPNGGRINIGAYGNTPEAASRSLDTDADELPDDWEIHWFANLTENSASDPDEDCIANARQYRYGWDPTTEAQTLVENATTGERYQSIQAAIAESHDGDDIVVHPGLYPENIFLGGKNVVLTSTNPSDPAVVANTIIDGRHAGSVVTFDGAEDQTCVLSGFTIRNGAAECGGGIRGGCATIRNNVITGNSARLLGGGLCGCGGLIYNNVVSGNSAPWGSSLDLWTRGGGFIGCSGIIRNNVISGNSADYGGGLGYCHGTIEGNLVIENSACFGGGLYECGALIRNNTIYGNSATHEAGGVGYCFECLDHFTGRVENSTIWANTAPESPQLSAATEVTFSSIQAWVGGGDGNIAADPQFLDPDNRNFCLSPSSPSIDVGFNDADLPATDIAGMHRIMYGGKSPTVDMGAYEYYINDIEVDANSDITLTWSSLSGRAYAIYSSRDMMTWELAAGSVSSSGDTVTLWLDPTAPLLSPEVHRRYYRIKENE